MNRGDIRQLLERAKESISQALIDLDNGGDRNAHNEIHTARTQLEDACSLLLWRRIQPKNADETA